MRQAIRRSLAYLGGALWVITTILTFVTVRLMSQDEEWHSWADAVPLLLLYLAVTAAISGVVWLLLRLRR